MRLPDGKEYYYLPRELYSVAALTDEDGAIVEAATYDTYGKVAVYDGSAQSIDTSPVGNAYYFTGRRLDLLPLAGGLKQTYHYRAREYNPANGRFLQRDPIEYADGMNPFEYTKSAPASIADAYGRISSFIDPHGEDSPTTQPTPPTSQPKPPTSRPKPPTSQPVPPKPVDICLKLGLLGVKGCDPEDIESGTPVKLPVNLLTLGVLQKACGDVTIGAVNCRGDLKFENVLDILGQKPCDQIKFDACKTLEGYEGTEATQPCLKKVGDDWVPDPQKKCCHKVAVNGKYSLTIPVDITTPVSPDEEGNHGGLCKISGTVTATIEVRGRIGQCVGR